MRRIDVFLPGLLPSRWLSPNRGERKQGRMVSAIIDAKLQMRGDVAMGLLAELRVREVTEPVDPCRVTLTQVWYKRASDGLYRAQDCGNVIYSLKAAIDGLIDAGLILDDSYEHVVELTGRIARCNSASEEGLRIEVEEVVA